MKAELAPHPDLPGSGACAFGSLSDLQEEEHELAWERREGHPGEEAPCSQRHRSANEPKEPSRHKSQSLQHSKNTVHHVAVAGGAAGGRALSVLLRNVPAGRPLSECPVGSGMRPLHHAATASGVSILY